MYVGGAAIGGGPSGITKGCGWLGRTGGGLLFSCEVEAFGGAYGLAANVVAENAWVGICAG